MNQDFVDLLRAFSDHNDVIGLEAFVTNKRATGRPAATPSRYCFIDSSGLT